MFFIGPFFNFKRKKSIKLISIVLFGLVIQNNLLAKTISYLRYWSAISGNYHFKNEPKLLYGFLLEGRFTNQPDLFYQGLVQGQIGYQTSDQTKIWLGYSWIPTTTVNHGSRENSYNQRIYEQIQTVLMNTEKNTFLSRSRLEERQQNGNSGINLRYRQLIEWDIKNLTIKNRYEPFISNELFLNLNEPSWENHNLVNQNRFIAGFSFPCFQKHNCRIAYLNQYQIEHPDNVMNHILYTSLSL